MNEQENEEQARAELVKLASDNGMYFVVWWGHCGNYFVGVRNEHGKKPEIYAAMYESFYDLTCDDEVLFRFRFNLNRKVSESEMSFSWVELLQEAVPQTVKSIIKNPV